MSPVRHAWRGSFLAALGAAALIGAVATAPAHAAPASKQHRNVHKTPKVPLVVDGVKYKPKQIHRFDGRPLYSAVAKDGKSLIAFTKLAPYKKYLRSLGVELPSAGDAKARQLERCRSVVRGLHRPLPAGPLLQHQLGLGIRQSARPRRLQHLGQLPGVGEQHRVGRELRPRPDPVRPAELQPGG